MNLIKRIILLNILLIPFLAFSQHYTETELVKNNIKEIKITAREYKNGKVFKEVLNKDKVNIYGNSVEFITYKSNGNIKTNIKSHYINHGKTKIDTTFKDDGRIKHLKVFTKDLEKRTISHYQIYPINDTVVTQIWYKNIINQDSILINNIKSKRYISKKWVYDEDGDLLEKTSYNKDGSLRSIDRLKSRKNGKCKIYFDKNNKKIKKECFKNGEQTTYFFSDKIGYLYGIKLITKNKGKKITTRNKKGLIESIVYFDSKQNALSEIIYEYSN